MKNRIVTLTVNIDVWVGIDEDVDDRKEVKDIMSQLNNRTLEEFGGCRLLTYSAKDIDDEDAHDYLDHYEFVDECNGR